jgi:hypothetical protein
VVAGAAVVLRERRRCCGSGGGGCGSGERWCYSDDGSQSFLVLLPACLSTMPLSGEAKNRHQARRRMLLLGGQSRRYPDLAAGAASSSTVLTATPTEDVEMAGAEEMETPAAKRMKLAAESDDDNDDDADATACPASAADLLGGSTCVNITHYRRFGRRACFEFLCVLQTGAGQRTVWVKYLDAMQQESIRIFLVERKQWTMPQHFREYSDTESIWDDDRASDPERQARIGRRGGAKRLRKPRSKR